MFFPESDNYLREEFAREMDALLGATSATVTDRISVVDMVPAVASFHPGRDYARAIAALPEPRVFLFCLFMSSLVDQAAHTRFKSFHYAFESDQRVPKICGILGSYWNILHPSYALAAASLWLSKEGEVERIERIASYFWRSHLDSMLAKFVKVAVSTDDRLTAQSVKGAIVEEILTASACRVSSLRPYSKIEPDLRQVEGFLELFGRKLGGVDEN